MSDFEMGPDGIPRRKKPPAIDHGYDTKVGSGIDYSTKAPVDTSGYKPNFGPGVDYGSGKGPTYIDEDGNHQTQGLKFDDDKPRMDLFPPEAMFAISTILSFGAKKYHERNWEKGMKWGRVFGACMRHLWAWWGGRGNCTTRRSFLFGELDSETGYSHLWHAGACIVFLIAYEERNTGEDDRWKN